MNSQPPPGWVVAVFCAACVLVGIELVVALALLIE